MSIKVSCILGLLIFLGDTVSAGLAPSQVISVAENWVKKSGIQDAAKNLDERVPRNQVLNGNVSTHAWGYRKNSASEWEVLFLVTVYPLPTVIGNETAYAVRIIVEDPSMRCYQAHGVATAYDNQPFQSYTCLEP